MQSKEERSRELRSFVNAVSWKIKPGRIGIEIRNGPNTFNVEIVHVDVPCALEKWPVCSLTYI